MNVAIGSLRLIGNLTVGLVAAVPGTLIPEIQFALSVALSSLSALHRGCPMPLCHASTHARG